MVSNGAHQSQLIGHIVHRYQIAGDRFDGGDTVQIRSGVTLASRTLALIVDRSEIFGERFQPQVQLASFNQRTSEPLKSIECVKRYNTDCWKETEIKIKIKKYLIHTAVLVGKTQSNMSTPRAQQTTRSVANPTPIKYLGLSLGSKSVDK